MAMTVLRCRDFEKEQAAANLHIRMFICRPLAQLQPQTKCAGKWWICSPETVGNFSGTAYFFARALHEQLKVPVGIIHSSWGGTSIEAWTSWEAQQNDKRL